MPRKRKNERVRCTHFNWVLITRGGTWYADGRSNAPSAGRHSLGTAELGEAQRRLPELDRVRAEDLGLIPRSAESHNRITPLDLEKGRKLYEDYIARPRATGGTRKSTQKRYRPVFNKFIPFAVSRHVTTWDAVTAKVLTEYASHLEAEDYAHKTLVNELTTLKQAVRWLIKEQHLRGVKLIELPLRKAESERAYCYRPQEVTAMVNLCRETPSLKWLADVIVALACTGLRIAELASLRWSDVDLEKKRLTLTDETGRSKKKSGKRREVKSSRSRSFPIHVDLLAVFRECPHTGSHVFYGPRGGALKPDTVRNVLIRRVIIPLASRFPSTDDQQGFVDGRLHSFRHYFCSACANSGVPERMVMEWLGHADSAMIRHYYHLHDEEEQRRMNDVNFLGEAGGRSADEPKDDKNRGTEPPDSEMPRAG